MKYGRNGTREMTKKHVGDEILYYISSDRVAIAENWEFFYTSYPLLQSLETRHFF